MCNCIKLVFILIISSVLGAINANDVDNPEEDIIRALEELTVEEYDYGDPCKPFSPQMPNFNAPGRRISEVKCFEYVWRSKLGRQELNRQLNCDFLKFRQHSVLGGRNAKYGEFAHMGALGWKSVSGQWVFKCGASLISNKFALTAAHCSSVPRADTTVIDVRPKIVRLGSKTIQDEKKLPAADAIIKQIIVHPRYRAPRRYYDIALLELEQEIEYQWLVHPSCLHTTFKTPEKGTIAGWGIIDLATLQTSPILKVAEVSLIESSKCDNLLHFRRNRHWGGIVRHQICAGHLAGGIDSCQGDSGGPLQQMIGKKPEYGLHPHTWTVHRIVGVTSFGYGCAQANTPGVYTRVASFVGWIESIVWPQNSTSTENRIVFTT